MTRVCKKCGIEKSLNDFPTASIVKGRKYFKHTCYTCTSNRSRESKWKYRKIKGSWEYFIKTIQEQNYTCAICNKKLDVYNTKEFRTNTGCLDHDHETNILRGILCSDCNRALGLFKDNPEILTKALSYLTRWKPKREKK